MKRGEVEGGDLTFLAWSSMVSDDIVTNRALPYSMSNDILRIVLCRDLVRRVVSLPKESLRRRVTDFFKTFKIVHLEGTFAISEVSLCFLVGLW